MAVRSNDSSSTHTASCRARIRIKTTRCPDGPSKRVLFRSSTRVGVIASAVFKSPIPDFLYPIRVHNGQICSVEAKGCLSEVFAKLRLRCGRHGGVFHRD